MKRIDVIKHEEKPSTIDIINKIKSDWESGRKIGRGLYRIETEKTTHLWNGSIVKVDAIEILINGDCSDIILIDEDYNGELTFFRPDLSFIKYYLKMKRKEKRKMKLLRKALIKRLKNDDDFLVDVLKYVKNNHVI